VYVASKDLRRFPDFGQTKSIIGQEHIKDMHTGIFKGRSYYDEKDGRKYIVTR
jgi:hypothetical protein